MYVILLLLLFLRRYALRRVGPSICLLYRKTVPSRAGRKTHTDNQGKTSVTEPADTKEGRPPGLRRRGHQTADSSSLAKLYIGSLPESISQPSILPVSRAAEGLMPCRTEYKSRRVRTSALSHRRVNGGAKHHITRCSTVSRPSPHAQ